MPVSLQSLRKIGKEKLILMLSLTVFLSYLPEAGEYASFFVYLRLVSLHFVPCDTKVLRRVDLAQLVGWRLHYTGLSWAYSINSTSFYPSRPSCICTIYMHW